MKGDIVTVAKGIASGLPLGVACSRADVMSWPPGAHASTFGGNPVACAAALTTIRLLKEQYVANAATVGEYLLAGIRELQKKHALVGDVRGQGLMIGIELVRDRTTKERAVEERNALVQAMFRRGVLILGAGKNAVRLAPPLVFTREQADSVLGVLDESLARSHPLVTSSSAHGALLAVPEGTVTLERQEFGKSGRIAPRTSSSAAGTRFLRVAIAPNMAKSTSWRETAIRPCSSRSRRGRPRNWNCRRGGDTGQATSSRVDGVGLRGAQRLDEVAMPVRRRGHRRRGGARITVYPTLSRLEQSSTRHCRS